MAATVGLIGLGVMGVPMAMNIASAGLPLSVFNRNPAPMAVFQDGPVYRASSAAEVFERSQMVVLMLKDGAATDAVLGRSGQTFSVSVEGRIIINTATTTPAYSRELKDAITLAGGTYVEAPVSGSKSPAEEGTLLVMTAGDQAALEKAAPIFEAIGKETIYCGDVPNAMAMKSASNVLLANIIGGLVEAVNFAKRADIDLRTFSKVILDGPMACDFLAMKLPKAVAEDYAPQAATKNVAYSIGVLLEAAQSLGAPTPGAKSMRAHCQAALAEGFADEDVLAVLKVLAVMKPEMDVDAQPSQSLRLKKIRK